MRLFTKLWSTLLLLCVASVANAATEYEIDQKFTSVAALDGQLFAIVNETDAKAIYNKDNQNLAYDSYTNAVGGAAYLFKLHSLADAGIEQLENAYAIECVKADGSSQSVYGQTPIYLNSGAEGGFDGCFVLGNGSQYGTDVLYGGAWEIEYDTTNGFALKNVARGGYFAGVNPAPTGEDPIYWTFCTLKAGEEIPDPVIDEPEAPLAQGELIPDFFSICDEGGIPYGYEVKFGSENRAYPSTFTGGARIFNFGENGDFTKAIYFREGYVRYGNVKALALEADKEYTVCFNSAMWKASGATLVFSIFKEGDLENAVLTQTIDNTPDVNGSKDAVTGSTRSEIKFTPEEDGNYILEWNADGWKEVLLANVAVKVAEAGEPEPQPETTFADGKYYFKNVGAGLYWGAGNSWGTQASLLKNPDYLTLVSNEDGTYKLESQVSNGGTAYYFNGSYLDNGSPVSLTITKLENGFYTIANGETFYGSDGSTILAALESGAEANAQWEIITEADMLASLANATKDAPVDATFLIADHTFGRNNRNVSAWTNEGSANLTGGNSNKHDAEKYHGEFNVYQKLANAPAGIYKFTAQGFYRQDGTDEENLPVFYANDEKVTFPVKTGSESSMADACTSFEAGLYAAAPIFVQVTEAGELTVGAKLETNTTLWAIWDNFELTYYGTEATIDEVRFAGLIAQLAELKADATALKDNEYITAAAITEIETAIAATEAEMTTEDDYNTAIATMQDVIKAANQAIKDNKIVVTGIVPDNELDNWACTNSNTFHINTWSTEGNSDGSEMKTPFIENWVGKPGPLGEGDITYTVPGTFEKGLVAQVSALIRIYSESGAEPTGASFFVNNDTVSIAEIGESFEYNEMKGVYANIKVKGAIGEDGKLIFGVNIAEPTFNWVAIKSVNFKVADETTIAYENALAAIKDGEGYRVFTEVEGTKYYLNTTGFLTDDTQKAATFEFNKVEGANETLYLAGWNLGVKFTNPNLTNGSTGDVVNDGHIHNGGNDRDNWERQVFFMNEDGKFAVRSTNANSANWGANTYWDVITEEELPAAGYSLEPAYVWQIEGFVDKRPEAFAKTQAWPMKLQKIEGLVKDAANWTSNAQEPNEGPIKNLIDMNTGTFFHSIWSATGPDEAHYIEATLPDAVEKFYISFIKRNDNNRPTQIDVSGGESEVQTITEGLPAAGWYTTAVNLTAPANVVRFSVPTTNNGTPNNGHQFFSMAEFYILPSNELTDAAAQYMVASYTDLDTDESVIGAINDIDAQIAALEAQIDLAADIEALAALADKFKAEIEATDNYIDATGSAAGTASAVITEVKGGTYSSIDEIEAAKAQLIAAAKTFYANVEPVEALNISDWFIVNPIAVAHKALPKGWEGDTFGDSSDGVSEYWNKAAASFHQTINLPAGSYKLTAVALQRTDMTGYVYAGEKQTTIVGVESSVANSRAQAAAWFAAGNGENEVWFTLDEAADVEIGIKADEANGDHWTVWQSFKLEKAIIPEVVLNAPTFNAEEGTQAEPNILPAGSTLKINFSADNLDANDLNADDLKVKVTVMVTGDLPENAMSMGSTTAHRVLGETFYIPLGETDFPVALKEGYVYQNIAVMGAELVKPATEEAEEESIAVYAGAPIQLHWVGLSNEIALTIDVERYPGMGYDVTSYEPDFSEALEFLGIENITDATLVGLNADGSEVANPGPGGIDGWCDADGNFSGWGDNGRICVKFFPSVPQFEICDMNGADEIGKTYTVRYALKANGKVVIYTINVTFVEKPVIDITFADLEIKDNKEVNLKSELGKCYEGLTADVDVAAILTALGVESLNDVTIYAVQSDGTLDDNYKLGTTDGWRNADGDWQSWGDAAYFFVKADFSLESAQIYQAGGMDGKNTTAEWEAPATYTARYAFVKSGSTDAVVLAVKLSYEVPTGIKGIAADVENGNVFNIAGQKTGRVQKGVNIIGGKKVYVK